MLENYLARFTHDTREDGGVAIPATHGDPEAFAVHMASNASKSLDLYACYGDGTREHVAHVDACGPVAYLIYGTEG